MSPSRFNGTMILLSWNLNTQFNSDINSRVPDNPSGKINLIIKSSIQSYYLQPRPHSQRLTYYLVLIANISSRAQCSIFSCYRFQVHEQMISYTSLHKLSTVSNTKISNSRGMWWRLGLYCHINPNLWASTRNWAEILICQYFNAILIREYTLR